MTDDPRRSPASPPVSPSNDDTAAGAASGTVHDRETGGREGPDPTRYGDWEKDGRCIDF